MRQMKTRQKAENKQTFSLTRKIDIEGKTCQNVENKQTFAKSFTVLDLE